MLASLILSFRQEIGLQDVAKMTLAALRSDATVKKTLTLSGPKAWTVPEVIELCEKLADERAQVTQVGIRSNMLSMYMPE